MREGEEEEKEGRNRTLPVWFLWALRQLWFFIQPNGCVHWALKFYKHLCALKFLVGNKGLVVCPSGASHTAD